ncbi:MAG: hypothetical protein JNM99_06510 [Verrucomicrobiaceae bacterium]|nr:hypothetical protein [Verrucomicrobiaceae bacterium]
MNKAGAKYVVVGGWAIIQSGYPRYTEDIDLLILTGEENEAAVLAVLSELPDRAAAQVKPGEVAEYGVVRIGDEVLVDLMKSGCGVTYADAIDDAVWCELKGVRIPFASKKTLWKMKQTLREKDNPDRVFLAQALAEEGIALDPPLKSSNPDDDLPAWAQALIAAIRSLFKRR